MTQKVYLTDPFRLSDRSFSSEICLDRINMSNFSVSRPTIHFCKFNEFHYFPVIPFKVQSRCRAMPTKGHVKQQ